MDAAWRACGARRGHCDGAGLIRGDARFKFPPLPCDPHPASVTRCQICHRTVACRPGNLSEVLAGHYRRAHPERSASLPGSPAAETFSAIRRCRHEACPLGAILPQGFGHTTPAAVCPARANIPSRR
jgi:hypothetical protein